MSEQVQIGPYQVVSKLGYGGMAIVYHAIDTRIAEDDATMAEQRDVALKILLPQYYNDEAFIRRFAKEGLNARRLKHPNIVQTYAAGHDDGYHYLAMEFVDGGTLEQHIAGRGPLAAAETISLLSPIGKALDYAHELGYVHRDMKLNNVMRAHDGHCLLTDFGVSKHLSTDLSMMTGMGQSIGTPSYMSPEQARGEKVSDGKSDIYSLGVIAYRLLTGQLPFAAEDVFELTHKIIFYEPVDPRQLNPHIDSTVAKALLQALAKNPAERPATCSAFVNALSGVPEQRPSTQFSFNPGGIVQVLQATLAAIVAKFSTENDTGNNIGKQVPYQDLYSDPYQASHSLNNQAVGSQQLASQPLTSQPVAENGPTHRNPTRSIVDRTGATGEAMDALVVDGRTGNMQGEDARGRSRVVHTREMHTQAAESSFMVKQRQAFGQVKPEPMNPEHVHAQRTSEYSEITLPGFQVPLHEETTTLLDSDNGPTTVELTVPVVMQMDVVNASHELKSMSAQPHVPSKFVPGKPLPGQPPRQRQKRTTTVLTQRVKRKRPTTASGATTRRNRPGKSVGHRGLHNDYSNPSLMAQPEMDNWFQSPSQRNKRTVRLGASLEAFITFPYRIVEPIIRPFRKNYNLEPIPGEGAEPRSRFK